jgi:Lrp/AsnC family transcriptional regulator
MAATAELDRIDREILRLLMQDASRSLAEIAAEVGLTPTPCWKRVKRMEEQGVITGRVALVDPARVGLPISVFVAVETGDHSADWIARFAAAAGCEDVAGAVAPVGGGAASAECEEEDPDVARGGAEVGECEAD